MLFRRISKHIKDQNWTAVGIDFFIVVIGVFIGIQVSNWNDDRTNRQIERELLERLQSQLSFVEATNDAIDEFGFQNLTLLNSAREVLFGVSERTVLTPEECNALGYSNVILTVGDDIPVLQELESTGRLEIISDQSVVNAIVNLSSAKKRENAIIAESRPFRIDLADRFPDLMQAKLTPDNSNSDVIEEIGAYDRTFSCDSKNMLSNREFLNVAGNNISYNFGVFEIATSSKTRETQDLVTAVNAALD